DDSSGVITVTNTASVAQLRIKRISGVDASAASGLVLQADRNDTLYVGGYDVFGNYIGDVVGTWYTNGTLDSTKLSPRAGSASVLNGKVAGQSGRVIARYNALADTTDGAVSLSVGQVNFVQVQSRRTGITNTIVSQSLTSDQLDTLHAAGYDKDSNYVRGVLTAWSVLGGIGGVTPLTASDSVIFNPNRTGQGQIKADTTGFSATSGLYTITVGDTAFIVIRTGGNNGGARYDTLTITMSADSVLNLYAASYDQDSNYVGDVAASWDTVGAAGGLTNFNDTLSFSTQYKPGLTGTGKIRAHYTNGNFRDTTGTITVIAGAASRVLVETANDGSGVVLPELYTTADSSITVYAVLRDAGSNFVGLQSSNWSVSGGIGTLSASPATNVTLTLTTIGSGQVTASGTFTSSSGIVRVLPGALASVKLRTDTLNQGIEFGTLVMSVGDSIRIYTAGYDGDGNFISNKAARYGVTSSSTLQPSRLFYANDSTSVLFKPTITSAGSVSDTSNAGNFTDTTGTITVTNTASIASVRINSLPNNLGAATGA
ncbi:hypothetical protein JNL27_16755, partial [bacterium]|nr:hypothetical protein [bacterium]